MLARWCARGALVRARRSRWLLRRAEVAAGIGRTPEKLERKRALARRSRRRPSRGGIVRAGGTVRRHALVACRGRFCARAAAARPQERVCVYRARPACLRACACRGAAARAQHPPGAGGTARRASSGPASKPTRRPPNVDQHILHPLLVRILQVPRGGPAGRAHQADHEKRPAKWAEKPARKTAPTRFAPTAGVGCGGAGARGRETGPPRGPPIRAIAISCHTTVQSAHLRHNDRRIQPDWLDEACQKIISPPALNDRGKAPPAPDSVPN